MIEIVKAVTVSAKQPNCIICGNSFEKERLAAKLPEGNACLNCAVMWLQANIEMVKKLCEAYYT